MNHSQHLELIDDVCSLLQSLLQEKNTAKIKKGLIEIVVYLRNRHSFSGRQTESIAELETSVITFLDVYKGDHFEEIYTIIREIIGQTPKFQIFDIDITKIRDITHDFDAAYRYNPKFKSIASDIRTLVHQHLSDKVIKKIEQLETFLQSDKSSGFIEGSTLVDVTANDKTNVLRSALFNELLQLKDKLKLAWANKNNRKAGLYSRKEFADVIELILTDLNTKEIKSMQSYIQYRDFFQEFFTSLKELQWEKIAMGKIRYYLKKLIEEVTGSAIDNKGEILFRLITIDALLEHMSFIYYSNIVNSELHEISDDNYHHALHILIDLALCTRAVGHGTKHLGRFAFLIESLLVTLARRPDRQAHFPSIIDTMNAELENNFSYLQEIYSESLRNDEKASVVNRILNNIIREKTTHLLGNLINNIKTYLDKKQQETYIRILDRLNSSETFTIKDYVYRFGTDIADVASDLECPEFMGGKGFSQITSSRIIVKNKLHLLDVPKGAGFSTLTWGVIKNNPERLSRYRDELNHIIRDLETRTGKRFGDPGNPLLLMARSGGVRSMPGILDTVSHIGINRTIAERWSKTLSEPGRAFQAYISFILGYAQSVLGLPTEHIIKSAGIEKYEHLFRHELETVRNESEIILHVIRSESGLGEAAIPDDPFEQIFNSTIAVFKSYENDIVLRQARNYGIPEQFQTACLVQECLPILSSHDCSGVFFTRNPNTGKIGNIYAEQIEFGEGFFGNVIADGMVTPQSIEQFTVKYLRHYNTLINFKYFDERLQLHPTDIEFAIRSGRTHIVQSRKLAQSPVGAIINSYDFYREHIYGRFKLIKSTAFGLNKKIIRTCLDRKELSSAPVIAIGKPVTGGAVRGRLIKDHRNIANLDGPLIFLTESNVPPRVIMQENKFAGYISKEGGITSHAALVAIGEGKPCVTDVNWEKGASEQEIILGGSRLNEGDFITLDANTGNIYREEIPIVGLSVIDEDYNKIKQAVITVIDNLIYEHLGRN